MIDQLKTYFPQIVTNVCLWKSNKSRIFIFDPKENKILEIHSEEKANFTIENPNLKEINILAIDKCIFDDDSGHKKCDFAAFDNQTFVFVEIKDTYKRRADKKKNAKAQLEDTIKKFQNAIDFSNYKVFIIISWRYKPIRPAISTGMQQAAFYFRENFNVVLIEGNQFTFN